MKFSLFIFRKQQHKINITQECTLFNVERNITSHVLDKKDKWTFLSWCKLEIWRIVFIYRCVPQLRFGPEPDFWSSGVTVEDGIQAGVARQRNFPSAELQFKQNRQLKVMSNLGPFHQTDNFHRMAEMELFEDWLLRLLLKFWTRFTATRSQSVPYVILSNLS